MSGTHQHRARPRFMTTSPAAAAPVAVRIAPQSANAMNDVTTPMRPAKRDGNGERTLRRGDSGPDVVALQQSLNRAGAQPALVEDGKLGPKTEAAVRTFQGARGLGVDGVVGADTRAALASDAPTKSAAAAKATGSRDG